MALYEVRQVEIPLTVSKPRLAAHARRIAELTRLFTAALPGIPRSELPEFAGVMPLGIAISQARDLGVIPYRGDAVRRAAWPGSRDAAPMRWALAADAPSFRTPRWGGRCPIPGSRGGKCNERGRNPAKWVTDMATGVWELRDMCDQHLPIAVERAATAPDPPPNRGGVLLAAFPDLSIPVWYAQAVPGWVLRGTPPAEPPAGEPPVLRLVPGDC